MTPSRLRSWHHGSKLHKRDFLKVQWLRIHTSIAGCLDWSLVGELKIPYAVWPKQNHKTAQETEGKMEGFSSHRIKHMDPSAPPRILGFTGHTGQTFLQAAFTYCFWPQSFLLTARPAWILSDSGIFSKLPLLAGCETERNMPIILFFFCLSHIPQSSDIITDFRSTLSESGLRYFSASLWRTRDHLARRKEPGLEVTQAWVQTPIPPLTDGRA